MKRITKAIAFFILSNVVLAQTEIDQINVTLDNYINGTSYSYINLIDSAFYHEANLYLDGKEGSMRVVPIGEYIGYFKNNEPGKFTGRLGRILSVDIFGNIASAKVEILIASRKTRYVDMFLLKKVNNVWTIISKTANSKPSNKTEGRILFILSSAHFYGNSNLGTGNSFSEIVNAYNVFDKVGYTVDFMSPEGGAVSLAYIMTSDTLQKHYLYNPDFMYALKNTKSPDQVDAKKYKAAYYNGGGSAMFGVADNLDIQNIVMEIYENNGIISAVCHGTAGIVNLKTTSGDYLVKNKTVSGYPESFERQDQEYFKQFPFHIQKTIEAHGGIFKHSERNTPHIEVDGRLITGQNHLSSEIVALKIVELIENEQDHTLLTKQKL